VKSKTSREFWKLFHGLPIDIQKLAYKNYLLWQNDSPLVAIQADQIQAVVSASR
jgi:hypothetical protein